ncbi:hypothetical protein Taro_049791 [Colocasia esculenta]|uniref:Retrotransposon gag domain-containing protein n=1 Tax=Colocasia esculenta TaxID=4460 RepID=A0A843XC09_COLES|nr:hypothetical protein [Colocasia esculenta]
MILDVPTFDGSLDPKVYLDWEAAMDRYFQWYDMTDGRRVRFAKMKLLSQAQTYWVNVESLLMQRYQDRIETWDDMKAKLRENRPVSEYIAEFDEYLLRCGVHEESAMTLSRFRKGLRQTYQRELFRRNVTTLKYAYQVAHEVELFESEYQPPSQDCGLVSHHLGTNHYPYLPYLHAHRAPFLLPDEMTKGRVLQVVSHHREVAHASSATVAVVLVTLQDKIDEIIIAFESLRRCFFFLRDGEASVKDQARSLATKAPSLAFFCRRRLPTAFSLLSRHPATRQRPAPRAARLSSPPRHSTAPPRLRDPPSPGHASPRPALPLSCLPTRLPQPLPGPRPFSSAAPARVSLSRIACVTPGQRRTRVRPALPCLLPASAHASTRHQHLLRLRLSAPSHACTCAAPAALAPPALVPPEPAEAQRPHRPWLPCARAPVPAAPSPTPSALRLSLASAPASRPRPSGPPPHGLPIQNVHLALTSARDFKEILGATTGRRSALLPFASVSEDIFLDTPVSRLPILATVRDTRSEEKADMALALPALSPAAEDFTCYDGTVLSLYRSVRRPEEEVVATPPLSPPGVVPWESAPRCCRHRRSGSTVAFFLPCSSTRRECSPPPFVVTVGIVAGGSYRHG